MTKAEIAKAIAALIVGGTTATVVREIIKNNVDPQKVTDKAAVMIASYVIGAIAADAAKQWSDTKIDEVIAKWQKFVADRNQNV
jgi:hypothetical protein